jgi:hypothetical protein
MIQEKQFKESVKEENPGASRWVTTEIPVKESGVEGKRKGGASLVISSELLGVKSRKAVRPS